MKKLALLLLLFLPILGNKARQRQEPPKPRAIPWNLMFTTGYVFKHDTNDFKEIFKNGIQDIITADICYYFFEAVGVGSKVSYWYTKERTFLDNPTKLQEIPLTFYLRTIYKTYFGLQPYLSLGGGAIFLKEKSYRESLKNSKGIGELELGLNWFLGQQFNFTGAFRYLFPRETFNKHKADIGGFDLRAGIGISF